MKRATERLIHIYTLRAKIEAAMAILSNVTSELRLEVPEERGAEEHLKEALYQCMTAKAALKVEDGS